MTYNGNHLFHYTRFESALKIISSRKLLFGHLKNMNDISESRKEILCDCDNVAIEETNKYMTISMTCDERHCRGFEIDSLWGHYADKGKGVCLVFDKLKLLVAFDSMKDFHKSGKIEYIEGSNGAIFFESEKECDIAEELMEGAKTIFFTKSKDWSIENEYRLLIRKSDERERALYFGDALMAVIICMPLCSKIEDACEYDILRHLTKVPILQYHTRFGNKELTCIACGRKLWPLLGEDYNMPDL